MDNALVALGRARIPSIVAATKDLKQALIQAQAQRSIEETPVWANLLRALQSLAAFLGSGSNMDLEHCEHIAKSLRDISKIIKQDSSQFINPRGKRGKSSVTTLIQNIEASVSSRTKANFTIPEEKVTPSNPEANDTTRKSGFLYNNFGPIDAVDATVGLEAPPGVIIPGNVEQTFKEIKLRRGMAGTKIVERAGVMNSATVIGMFVAATVAMGSVLVK
ncbi:hypothetical protein MSAN_00844600 [Mycena sanguinolenta]|uniref:Uncharacterized protein n=1 Tax=Mycena sanguinolenta TaxID=230812 RepID=A0A8H6YZW0_9AGAR|nr:hypothetical protein MSAN_00844600 [Mycena sanguinolenta]